MDPKDSEQTRSEIAVDQLVEHDYLQKLCTLSTLFLKFNVFLFCASCHDLEKPFVNKTLGDPFSK